MVDSLTNLNIWSTKFFYWMIDRKNSKAPYLAVSLFTWIFPPGVRKRTLILKERAIFSTHPASLREAFRKLICSPIKDGMDLRTGPMTKSINQRKTVGLSKVDGVKYRPQNVFAWSLLTGDWWLTTRKIWPYWWTRLDNSNILEQFGPKWFTLHSSKRLAY